MGAGLAGLVATRDVVAAGVPTIVLEARERVGGRVLTVITDSGAAIDLGGQWVGPGHDRARALAGELGLKLVPAPTKGRATARVDGRTMEMGDVVPAAGALARLDLYVAGWRLDRLVGSLALDDPGAGTGMGRRDEVTAASWLEHNLRTSTGRRVARSMVELCFAFVPEQTSLLGLLLDIRAAGSIRGVLGAQTDFVFGGAQQLATGLAERLGDRVVKGAAVDRVAWSDEVIEIDAGGRTWRSRAAAICIPPAMARRIEFTPTLPGDRAALLAGMLPGDVIKALAVYDEPFWRQWGHSGSTFNAGFPLVVTADVSPPDSTAGVLVALACASGADRLRDAAVEQEGAVLSSLAELFGEPARAAREVFVNDWRQERFTGGCYAGHFTPGTLKLAGARLRARRGSLRWGGTETATEWHGYMEGAIRSGERVAREPTT